MQIFLLNPTVKEFRKSSNIWQSYEQKISLVFFDSQCSCIHYRGLYNCMGVDHGGRVGQVPPEFGVGALMQIVPQILPGYDI